MNKHKRHGSLQTVPFSWEHLPGISKAFAPHVEEGSDKSVKNDINTNHTARENLAHGSVPVPLPPCPYRYQPNLTTKAGFIRPEEDPFLAAYIECTKTVKERKRETKVEKKGRGVERRNSYSWAKIEKLRFGLGFSFGLSSCKSSSGVREGNLVKLTKLDYVDYHVDELE